jgi:predicted Fe-Mo cluster-binding NifX family protein
MKAAIPVNSDTNEALISVRFARSPYLAVVDTEKSAFEIIENAYNKMHSGAGRSIIEFLVTIKQVNTIIAYELGLNIQQKALQKKIQLIILKEKEISLKQLLKLLRLNQ